MGIEATLDTPLAESVRKVGSQSAFARLVGKSQSSVHTLMREGKPLWAEAVLKIEAATGVSRHRLRPDIYGAAAVDESAASAPRPTNREPTR